MNTSNPVAMRYRPDIDGLRAIAVLSVIVYHLRNSWIPGGYVGVDIFFVISGFLITRNIWTELQAGRFSLGNFYLRRIRRIAPAMFVVTAVTLAAGMFLLLPADLLRLGKSAVWSTLSAANLYFWRFLDTSYFAAASDQEPLLHLWSLGVEEQFYLSWPGLLMAFAASRSRSRRVATAGIVLICIASFAMAELTNISAPKFSYYMLPARAGELMLGALLALWATGRENGVKAPSLWLAEACAIIGLGLIAYALWLLDDRSPFPGINALYPSVGATLVILSGHFDSRLTRALLTSKPLVFVGLISYSLYLWHWPILAFIRYFYGEVGLWQGSIAALAIGALSVLSYRFVEQPARHLKFAPLRQVLVLAVAPMAALLLAGGFVIRTDGLKSTIESSEQFRLASERLDRLTRAADKRAFPCMDATSPVTTVMRDPRCVLGFRGNPTTQPAVLLWGDSNAGHFVGALDAFGRANRFEFRYLSLSTCPSVFGEGEFGAPYMRDRCRKFREDVRRSIAESRLKIVVLASQWSVHDLHPEFRTALDRTITELEQQGLRVVMLGQVPWFAGYNRDCDLRWGRIGKGHCEQRMSRADQPPLPVSDYMAQLANRHSAASFLTVHEVLCEDGRCSPYVDNVPVYFNPTHLSAKGSYRIGEAIAGTAAHAAWIAAFSSGNRRSQAVAFDGFRPQFKYAIRSQRHEPSGAGQYRHVVIAEYIDAESPDIQTSIKTGLAASGFSVEGPVVDRDSLRYVARNPQMSTLVVVVHAKPALKLISPGAKGVVSFSWKDRQIR